MAPISTSPKGCYGQTDNPHWSSSGNESSVHGRTKCSFPVPELGVSTTLWHYAWFGWNPLASDSSSRTNSTNSQDAHPHYGCSSPDENDFLGTSSHYSIEGGVTYTGTTSNGNSFVC